MFENVRIEQAKFDAAHYEFAEEYPEVLVVALTELKSNIIGVSEFVNQYVKIYINVDVTLLVSETEFR